MSAPVRPWLLFGGIGLVAGFVLGIVTVNLAHSHDADIAPPLEYRPPPRHAPVASAPAEVEKSADTTFHIVATPGRPALGPDNAPVTIVEFTDYECPFCQEHFTKTLPLVLGQYGDRVRYVVMNLPIPELHPDALAAAEAAECATDQNRFWPYHDRLFAARELDRETFVSIASQLHLDGAAFATCVDTHATAARVRAHMAQATALGIKATPTFYINGRVFDGVYPFDEFRVLIDSAIARASLHPTPAR